MPSEDIPPQSTSNSPKKRLVLEGGRIPQPHQMRSQLSAPHQRKILNSYEGVIKIADAARSEGGQALLVGGSVRDLIVGTPSKDFDVEVHRLAPDVVERIARRFGKVSDVGKSFEVLKVWPEGGIDIDVSLPRKERKIGKGHGGFETTPEPNLGIENAMRRRDFTMNAIAADPLTGEIFDPFSGMVDLENSLLKIVDPVTFVEDPLRAMRALQFIGRFDLKIDPNSAEIIKELAPTLKELPKERLLEEWVKLLTKSPYPSQGLMAGAELGIFSELHPELIEMRGAPLDPTSHPEGDIWTHTLLATDIAATIAHRENLNREDTLVVMLATLLHELEKLDGDLSLNRAKNFLKCLGLERTKIAKRLLKLLEHHQEVKMLMTDIQESSIPDGTIRRFATKLSPASLYEVSLIIESDDRGRGPIHESTGYYLTKPESEMADWLLQRSKLLGIDREKPGNIIEGRDIIRLFKCKPGQHIGRIIQLANDLRDRLEFTHEQIVVLLTASKSIDDAISNLERELDRQKN